MRIILPTILHFKSEAKKAVGGILFIVFRTGLVFTPYFKALQSTLSSWADTDTNLSLPHQGSNLCYWKWKKSGRNMLILQKGRSMFARNIVCAEYLNCSELKDCSAGSRESVL